MDQTTSIVTEIQQGDCVQVSVIVVTYDSELCIKNCLESVLSTALTKFEVIVLDNGSHDETLTISSKFDGIRLVSLGGNIGLCKARNIGASLARGNYLAFIDHDTVVDPTWLEAGLEGLATYPDAGIIMFEALSLRNPHLISFAGKDARGASFSGLPAASFKGVRTIFYPLGAGFMVSKDAFWRIGGFDEDFFVGNDDIDFGWRAWLVGFKPICISRGVIYHDPRILRGGKASGIFRFYGARNLLCMYVQNLSGQTLLLNLPMLALGYPFAALFRGGFEGICAMYSVLFKELRRIYLKRLAIQQRRQVDDHSLMPYTRSIFPVREYSRDWRIIIAYSEGKFSRGIRTIYRGALQIVRALFNFWKADLSSDAEPAPL
jgi:GT2 family glycosyltransferase